jgi:hypothetical protein
MTFRRQIWITQHWVEGERAWAEIPMPTPERRQTISWPNGSISSEVSIPSPDGYMLLTLQWQGREDIDPVTIHVMDVPNEEEYLNSRESSSGVYHDLRIQM